MKHLSLNKHAVYTTQAVRELDRIAIEDFSIPAYKLMERAGLALLQAIQQHFPSAHSICIMCGIGNNGGDGYVLGRLAQAQGYKITVLAITEISILTGSARQACEDYFAAGGVIDTFQGQLPKCDVLVDALFGSGLSRPLEGLFAQAIFALNQHKAPVLAADIPSGLNADTGQVLGVATKADITLSFIALKQGLLTGQARDYVGDLYIDDLSLPPEVYQRLSTPNYTLNQQQLRATLKPRTKTAHKGLFGHSLLVGGAAGMSGAIRLAGEAALRTGSGLVTLATHAEHAAWLNLNRPELMVQAVEAEQLRTLSLDKTVIGIGPGLGQSQWAHELLRTTLVADCPLVLDADALNLLAAINWHNERWVLTPHPAEAARLLACSTADIERNRVLAAQQLQQQYGGVIVLKGAGTLVASKQRIAFCTTGNPGMASGGMGDVLTGIITALIAQGLTPVEAAELGVYIHASAGDQAATNSQRGLLASDVIAALTPVVNPDPF